jgi:hypothetical protein
MKKAAMVGINDATLNEFGVIEFDGLTIAMEQTSREWCENTQSRMFEGQRKLKSGNLKGLIRDIQEGRWKAMLDPFHFTKDGICVNGNHRNTAFLATGFYPPVLVVRGLDPDAYVDLDRGVSRSYSDAFKAEGIHSYSTASTVSLMFLTYGVGSSARLGFPIRAVLDSYNDHVDSIKWAMNRWKDLDGILSSGRRVFLASLAYETYGRDKAEQFMDGLVSSVGPSSVRVFRKLLVADSNKSRGRLSQHEVIALGIKALRAFGEGREIAQLRWLAGEAFPELPRTGQRSPGLSKRQK